MGVGSRSVEEGVSVEKGGNVDLRQLRATRRIYSTSILTSM